MVCNFFNIDPFLMIFAPFESSQWPLSNGAKIIKNGSILKKLQNIYGKRFPRPWRKINSATFSPRNIRAWTILPVFFFHVFLCCSMFFVFVVFSVFLVFSFCFCVLCLSWCFCVFVFFEVSNYIITATFGRNTSEFRLAPRRAWRWSEVRLPDNYR